MNKRTVGLVALESFITRGEKKKAQYQDLMIEVDFVKELLNKRLYGCQNFSMVFIIRED